MNRHRPTPSRLKLAELAIVNDVLAEAATADRPLERQIDDRVAETRGRPKRVLKELGEMLRAGDSPADAIRGMPDAFPTRYADVVAAGVRADRLGPVLAAFSDDVWRATDLRRQIGRLLVYPSLVLVTAYVLSLFVLGEVLRRYVATYRDIRLDPPLLLDTLHAVGRTSLYWGWIPPLIFLVFLIRWRGTDDARLLATDRGANPLLRVPAVASALTDFRSARLARLVADLVGANVPLGDAVRLGLAATDDDRDADDEADSGERLPPYLAWLVANPGSPGDFAAKLAGAAEVYRGRAERALAWFRLSAPVALVVVIGGAVTLLYGLSFFVPLIELLDDLARPVAPMTGGHR